MKTIITSEQFRSWKFPISQHFSDDKLLKVAREVEQIYIRAWCGDVLFDWLLENVPQSSPDVLDDFYNDFSEIIARLGYCRLLIDNEQITRLKAVEKRNEFSQNVQNSSIRVEIDTQRNLAKEIFEHIKFPDSAPIAAPKVQKTFFLNEFFI